ncbi:hypothetical protein EMCRGX_G016685 [Ephydatia muelleri]
MKVQLAAARLLALVLIHAGIAATTSPLDEIQNNFHALSDLSSAYELIDATKFQAMCNVLRQVRSNVCNETDSLDEIRNVTCSYVSGMPGISATYTCQQVVDVLCVIEEIRILLIPYNINQMWNVQVYSTPDSLKQSDTCKWIKNTFVLQYLEAGSLDLDQNC